MSGLKTLAILFGLISFTPLIGLADTDVFNLSEKRIWQEVFFNSCTGGWE